MSDMLYRLLQKGPPVLGAQASSPARVQRNQRDQWLLVRRDTGRRGRLRSQDRGALFARASLACRDTTNQALTNHKPPALLGLGWLWHDKLKHIGHKTHSKMRSKQI